MKRIMLVGAISAGIVTLALAGAPPVTLAQESPLDPPEDQKVLDTLAAETAMAIASFASEGNVWLALDSGLSQSARIEGYLQIGDKICSGDSIAAARILLRANYAPQATHAHVLAISSYYPPEYVVKGLRTWAEVGEFLDPDMNSIGVGVARTATQYRMIIITAHLPESLRPVTSGQGGGYNVYLPKASR